MAFLVLFMISKQCDDVLPKSEFLSFLSVLNCEPSLKGMEELIHELNKTNGLFKYVRVMRRKFQESVAQGTSMALYMNIIIHG